MSTSSADTARHGVDPGTTATTDPHRAPSLQGGTSRAGPFGPPGGEPHPFRKAHGKPTFAVNSRDATTHGVDPVHETTTGPHARSLPPRRGRIYVHELRWHCQAQGRPRARDRRQAPSYRSYRISYSTGSPISYPTTYPSYPITYPSYPTTYPIYPHELPQLPHDLPHEGRPVPSRPQ